MPDLVTAINVGSDHTLPVVPSGPGAEVVVNVTGGDTVYYADTPAVTSASNQGSLSSGGSATFLKQVWLRSASVSQVTLSNLPVSSASRLQTALTARGLIAESFSLATAAGGTTVSTQQIWCSLVGLTAGDVVSNAVVAVSTAGAGTAPTLIKLALVDTGGNVLAATGNVNSDAKWTSTGLMQFPLTTPFTVQNSGGYYVAILQNGVFGTTPLQVLREGGTPAQIGQKVGSGARLFALGGTAQTDITGTLTLADGGSGVSAWFGVS